jgi:hypothetical protein
VFDDVSFDVPTLQLIAYSALTCASVIVAAVSLILGYRQNFGWPPIVLVTSHIQMGSHHPPDEVYEFTLEFEVWNRRKYPVSVFVQDLTFRNVNFVRSEVRMPSDYAHTWDGGPEFFSNWKGVLLEPNGHAQFEFVHMARDAGRKKSASEVEVSVAYFDPIKNKYLKAKMTSKISA